jgi:hypothetical protein
MRNIKCSDCAEYQNEWCEKIIDSPHPDIFRDCQYWQKRKDMVEVVRCRDCRYGARDSDRLWYCTDFGYQVGDKDGSGFCSDAERRTDEND